MKNYYLNINLHHNIMFYILSSFSKEDLNDIKIINSLIDIIKEVFKDKIKNDEDLKEIFLSEPRLENGEMICKGQCGISINAFIKKKSK